MKPEYLDILKEAFASVEADDLYATHSEAKDHGLDAVVALVVAPWAARSVAVTMNMPQDNQTFDPIQLWHERATNAARVMKENMRGEGVSALRSDKYRSVKFPDDYIPLKAAA